MPRHRVRRAGLALATLCAFGMLAACGDNPAGAGPAASNPSVTSGPNGDASGTLTVFAASSLTEAFTALQQRFEHQHPAVRVVLSFDSSATLAQQVEQGAPAGVLATADQQTMATVTRAGLSAGRPRLFTTNTLTIVTPPDNPAQVTGVADLARPGTVVVMCAPSAPCGSAAAQLLRLDHVHVTPSSYEPDVKSVLTKVTLGEADAGIVYVSDARAAGDRVHAVAIRRSHDVVNRYPITVVKGNQSAAAREWVKLVLSPTGQRVLHRYGFGTT